MRLIDADAITRVLEEWKDNPNNDDEAVVFVSHFLGIIRTQPTVKPKSGRWIRHGEPPWYVIECSECGAKWHMSGSWDANNYCGSCGARMESEE